MKKTKQITNLIMLLFSISLYMQASDPKTTAGAPAQSITPTAAAQKTKQAERGLIQATTMYQNAKTPKEKSQIRKIVLQKAKEAMAAITEERNLMGEVRGYLTEEEEAAKDSLEALLPEQTTLKYIVDDLQKQKKALENKGWLWNTVKTGKEKEHEKITKKLNKLEPELKELNKKVRDQTIIAGQQDFTKTRALIYGSLATVFGVTGFYVLAPTLAKAEYENFKSSPAQYAMNRLSSLKNMVSSWFGRSATNAVSATALNAATNTISQSLDDPGIITRLGANIIDMTSFTIDEVKKMTGHLIVGAIASKVVTKLYEAVEKLEKLIMDPNATPEQLEAQNKEVQRLTQQAQREAASKKVSK